MNRTDRNAGLGRNRAHAHARRQQWRNSGPSGMFNRARGAANPLLSALMIHYSAKASRVPERRIGTSGFAVI